MEGFQYPHYSGAPCVNETFASCQKIFNNNLNISSNADWTDPNEFLRQLNAVLQRGVTTGLVPLCNAWQQLYNCLGTSYYSCFNPVYLISQGTGLQPAFQFTAEILRTQFKCVGGFEQSVKKYDCIISGFQNTNAIDQCLATWNQTLNNNFNQLCQATQNLTTCFMNIFASCGNEVQWWICEDVRVGFSLFNCPDLRCYVR
uniref:Uncharacterized protein n=1 Tax=Plectus sambesii TaxID=2011161 RepID=A0A914VIW9_9BILA